VSASRAFLLPAVLLVLLAAGPLFAVEVVPSGFVVEHVETWELGPPHNGQLVSFAMLPDSRFIFVERVADSVDVGIPGGANPTRFGYIPDVSHGGFEEGLLGVAVDPDWPTRPYLYFYYNQISNNCYLTRYEVTGDLTNPTSTNLALTNPYFVLTDIQDVTDSHQGGSLRFGPDGMLYLGIGDDTDGCNAQDPSIPTGSILRMDVSSLPPGAGGPPPKADLVPSGNPLSGPGDWERLNWAYGFRNPFRFNIDPVNGDLGIGDVGFSTYEELDAVPYSSPGGNFGWPSLEGPIDPMCCGNPCGPGPPFVDPIFAYPHVGGPATVIAGGPYRGLGAPNAFPAEYERNLFCLEFFDGWIRRFVFNGTTWEAAPPVPGQPTADHWAEGFDQMADFQVAPDGSLYLLRIVGTARGVYAIRPDPALGVDVAEAASGFSVRATPNPAGRGESIRFRIRTPGETSGLRLLVTDVAGRTVAEHDFAGATDGTWEWNRAGSVSAGVYFYRLEADGRTAATGKVTTLR
jgi:glucose/arabinose dehydrogenase